MAVKVMSLRAFARHRGVALSAVQKAIREGRISPLKSGKIDVAKADLAWDQNTDPAKKRGKAAESGSSSETYMRARAAREAYNAKLAKLNYETRAAQLVDSSTVQRRAFENARIVRDALLNIPIRIGPELASEIDVIKIQNILTIEINRVLLNLSGDVREAPKMDVPPDVGPKAASEDMSAEDSEEELVE